MTGLISYSTVGPLGMLAEKYSNSLIQKAVIYTYKKIGKHSYRKWKLEKFTIPWKKYNNCVTNNVIA